MVLRQPACEVAHHIANRTDWRRNFHNGQLLRRRHQVEAHFSILLVLTSAPVKTDPKRKASCNRFTISSPIAPYPLSSQSCSIHEIIVSALCLTASSLHFSSRA